MKRVLDVLLSVFGLLLTAPVFLVVACAIRVGSPGPVFFRGVRTGLYGKPFRIFKFRTMIQGAEQKGAINVAEMDSRVTRLGRFLRRTKLDELPQLISVLLGDMSFVGPRPEVPFYTSMFTDDQKRILSVRPGITDWASLVHFDQYVDFSLAADPDEAYLRVIRPTKLALQQLYVDNQSFRTDLRILFATLVKVLARTDWLPVELRPCVDRLRDARSRASADPS